MSRFWTLGHLLRRCHQAYIAIWGTTCGQVPTAPQYAVLSVVAETNGADMQLVGAVAGLEKTTLTGVARRLERDGWIQRHQDPRDRRRHLLALTGSGRLALRQTDPLAATAQADFLAPVPARDHERLMRHLRELSRVSSAPPLGAETAGAAWQRATTTPGHLIRRAQQTHTAHWLGEFGQELTGPQYAVLRMVGLQGETTHSRLWELAALDKATLSVVVDRLVRHGLLAALPDPSDKRVRRLALTDAGRDLERSARPRVRRVQRQTAEPVAEGDRLWLLGVLERLAFRSGAPEIDLDDLAVDTPDF
ncbi:MarR family winged helix-turn-helix transcriptional regulator [Streptomyces sp. NPDC086080]|uniref:MarR family winged helix-turn-helix transcriptional regulator n=1 Tax=Streptomyces sp. NPDC086080 TaxID=3365748 RepID=UPI0037CCCA48